MIPVPASSLFSRARSLSTLPALLFFLILLPWIGLASVGGSSEARELHIAQVILRDGEWLFPTRNGLVPSKPPLFHWLTAAISGSADQVTPFKGRLISLFSATAIIWCTSLLALAITRRLKLPIASALAAPIVLALTHGFLVMAGDARVDMLYSAFVVGAITSLLLPWLRAPTEPHYTAQLTFWALCSLAVLTKGPLGFVLPVIITFCLGWRLLGFRTTTCFFFRPHFGWLILLVVGTSWYFAAAFFGHSEILERQLIFENLLRLIGGEKINQEPPWFYLASTLRSAFPWSIIFAVALVRLIFTRKKRLYPSSDPARSVGLIWFLAGVLLFSLASGKRHSYLLPLFPGLALSVALAITEWFAHCHSHRRLRINTLTQLTSFIFGLLGVATVLTMLLITSFPIFATPVSVTVINVILELKLPILVMGSVLTLGGLLFPTFLHPHTAPKRVLDLSSVIFFCFVAVTFISLSIKNNLKNFPLLATQLHTAAPNPAELTVVRDVYDECLDPLLYYFGERVTLVSPAAWQAQCRAGKLFVGRSSLLKEKGEQNSSTKVRAEIRQPLDQARGYQERDISVWECTSEPETP